MKNKYEKFLLLAIVIAVIVAISVITLGVLTTPIILAFMYSWYWLFLYVGYLLAILSIALYIITTQRRGRKNESH